MSFRDLLKNTIKKIIILLIIIIFYGVFVCLASPDKGKGIGELLMKASFIDFFLAVLVALTWIFFDVLIIYWLIFLLVKIFNKIKDTFKKHSGFIYRSFFVIVRVIGFLFILCFLTFLQGFLYNIIFESGSKETESTSIIYQNETKDENIPKTIDQVLKDVFLELNKIHLE